VSTPFQHSQVPQEALKSVVLGILDEAWLDLQDHMETLTDGAHLVAYASAKPEEAYAQEGLKAFQEMRLRIQKDLACKVLPRLLAMDGLPANPTSDSSKP
jgi:preprotein translocase subunit SecA